MGNFNFIMTNSINKSYIIYTSVVFHRLYYVSKDVFVVPNNQPKWFCHDEDVPAKPDF